MAIAFDAVSKVTTGIGGGSSITLAHTCTGANRGLFVCIGLATASDHVTGVTYNGVSMTRVGSYIPTNGQSAYVYYLAGPASGTNNIVASINQTYINLCVQGVSYTGVAQSNPAVSATSTGTSTITDVTCTLTTLVANSWTFMYTTIPASGDTAVAGAGTTLRGSGASGFGVMDSNAPIASPSSTSLAVHSAGLDTFYNIMFAIAPPGTGTPGMPSVSPIAVGP